MKKKWEKGAELNQGLENTKRETLQKANFCYASVSSCLSYVLHQKTCCVGQDGEDGKFFVVCVYLCDWKRKTV